MEEKIYKKEEDGSLTLIETIIHDEPTQEELIADKEAELLAMYNELQELKNNSAE